MTDLVEKVARAICDSESALPFEEHTGAWQEIKRAQASAVLRVVREALAEPDAAMRAAARDAETTRDQWQAMLAASPLGGIEE